MTIKGFVKTEVIIIALVSLLYSTQFPLPPPSIYPSVCVLSCQHDFDFDFCSASDDDFNNNGLKEEPASKQPNNDTYKQQE